MTETVTSPDLLSRFDPLIQMRNDLLADIAHVTGVRVERSS